MTGAFIAGVDGCRGGWVAFTVCLDSRKSVVEMIDLASVLRDHPDGLLALAVDIPIGLLDGPRACGQKARSLLGPTRGCSVFPAPTRAAIQCAEYSEASRVNFERTGRKLNRQTWCISPKIKEVDDAITPDDQKWAFEVHPEVSFWAMNSCRPMVHRKKKREGKDERLNLLSTAFPTIEEHIHQRPPHVEIDDLLDAASAAWSALRIHQGVAHGVCSPEWDDKGLEVTIRY